MKPLFLFFSLFLFAALLGQTVPNKSDANKLVNARYQQPTWLINLSYKAAIPSGSLALRYGFMNGTGLDFYYKSKNNFLWGLNTCLFFGSNVNGIDYINIFKDANGYVFANDGNPLNITASMRGSQLLGVVGKLIPGFHQKKPQLSILLECGVGFLQHKYLFNAPNTLQFSKEYLKGYDRLSNGLALTQEIGLCNFGLNRLINFNIGIEVTEAFTRNRRYYDYATGGTDTKSYADILYSLKCSWLLPISSQDKKQPLYFK